MKLTITELFQHYLKPCFHNVPHMIKDHDNDPIGHLNITEWRN